MRHYDGPRLLRPRDTFILHDHAVLATARAAALPRDRLPRKPQRPFTFHGLVQGAEPGGGAGEQEQTDSAAAGRGCPSSISASESGQR